MMMPRNPRLIFFVRPSFRRGGTVSAHAARHAERGGHGGEDADEGLQDEFPRFFLGHDFFFLGHIFF